MLAFLQERGPDHQGVWSDNRVALGHTRLSIIDLSVQANQPMTSEDGSLIISFNGEIFNYQALRSELRSKGAKFNTESDTEVLLAGFRQWGIEILLQKVNGMFAFALYDRQDGTVVLARDTLGEKPLYYLRTNESFIFASSINSIHALYRDQISLDYDTIDYYLSEQSSPQPNTIWKEIKQIDPAHYTKVSLEPLQTIAKRYWEHEYKPLDFENFEDVVTQTKEILQSAVKRRSISDVPIASFLSGGVDSGLITAFLAECSEKPIKTFTVAFKDSNLSEHVYAEEVAKRYATDHETVYLDSEVLQTLPKLISYIGEPFADASLIPAYHISNAISNQVKVALSGDGGDEFFGGYTNYLLAFKAFQLEKKFPLKFIREFVILMSKIASRFDTSVSNLGDQNDFLRRVDPYKLWRGMGFSQNEKGSLAQARSLLNPGFTETYFRKNWEYYKHFEGVNQLMMASLNTRLLDDYLVKIDRSSMINSLEVRSPFLDKELVSFAVGIPASFKFYGGLGKSILKKIAAEKVSSNITNRPKMGFEIPLRNWLDNSRNWASSLLLDGLSSRDLFNSQEIELLVREQFQREKDHSQKIWNLLCLEIWMSKYLD